MLGLVWVMLTESRKAAAAENERMPSERDLLASRTFGLSKGAALFRAGDKKSHVFRLEAGEIQLTWLHSVSSNDRIEIIRPGSFLGLGFLKEYVCDAIASKAAVVSWWTPSESLLVDDLAVPARQRRAFEVQREFDIRREMLVASAPAEPHRRLAGFLCLASRLNVADGRDATVIDETVDCPSVCAFLQMDMETLERALMTLRNLGLVEYSQPRALRILDLERLNHEFERYQYPLTRSEFNVPEGTSNDAGVL